MAETGSMRNRNSRRGQTSITHLMNINLPPRPQDYRNTLGRHARRGNIYGIGSGHHVSDKARFIHANYRFIVKPNGDYKSQASDADQHLDWDDVLQILASSISQDSSCPICLSHPVAPRMAKCGHIFCLPCLIRYMHATEDTTPVPEKKARCKSCPICWDAIYASETKPVRWFTGQEGVMPREGEDVVLQLVRRQPGSTLALPRDAIDVLGRVDDIPWYMDAEVMDYARIMKGGEQYMAQQFDAEIEDLKRQENEDELMFGEEPEWTRKAVKSVHELKAKIQGIGDPPAPKQPSSERKLSKQPLGSVLSSSIDEDMPINEPGQKEPVQPPNHPPNEVHNPNVPYFFYQALLHYYLAPLDIRILKTAFGNFSSFPSTLLPRVERVSAGKIIDDDLRRRAKYLAHLPSGCEIGFIECNWTDVVAPEILEKFRADIDERRKRNREKENREERDRVRAEKAEDDARWATARRKIPIVSDTYSGLDFSAIASSSPEASSSSPPWTSRQGSSFASLASPSSSPPGAKTVWGTTLVTPVDDPTDAGAHLESNINDGWLASWEQDLIVESELVSQVEAASLETPKPGGKKKKQKKITLMSTTVRRAA